MNFATKAFKFFCKTNAKHDEDGKVHIFKTPIGHISILSRDDKWNPYLFLTDTDRNHAVSIMQLIYNDDVKGFNSLEGKIVKPAATNKQDEETDIAIYASMSSAGVV